MNERKKDENWLDDQLRRAVNTTAPEFDADAWKRDYPEAYETLVSDKQQAVGADIGVSRRGRLIVGGLAAAAVILIGVAILWMQRPLHEPPEPSVAVSAKPSSPAEMLSMMALRTAYQQGGQEALNRQLDAALTELGPRPNETPTLRLLSDFAG